jgi:prepilin-type N-terminal cleavage/methylation domain-containing protein
MINKYFRGFTLIETLVAVLILATAIAGPLTIAARGLSVALVAKDQVTAYYLAQDGLEYLRAKRDSACLSTSAPCSATANAWLSTVSACQGATCYLDSTENTGAVTPTACSGTCPVLNYDSTNKRFTYAGTNGTTILATIYRRTVLLTNGVGTNDCSNTVGHGCESTVTVTVAWTDVGGTPRSVVISENLFNWE